VLINHLQQVGTALLALLFGVLALRVWRRAGPARRDRSTVAWGLTAAQFIVVGLYASVHSLLSAAAWMAGRDSALFRAVGEWAVAANLGRAVVSVVFGVMLVAALVVHRRWVPRVSRAGPAVLAGTAVIATLAARRLPPASIYSLATSLAVLSMVTAVVVMAALLAAVLNDSMDQLLWLALAAFALKETVSVSLFAVLAWWSMAAHAEAYRIFYWLAMALTAGMAGLAARRLRMAAAGRRVPALFERLHALRRPAPERPFA
jgi:hypothetical protein